MTDVFYEDLAKTRQQIHQHPEVSEDEHETTIFLKGYLRKLGIEPLNYPLKTGLIAEIGSGHPIIALRADIDALPIQENTGLSYASENGAMHACGHDFHQTSLLGAAQILKEREAELKGTVRLIFQPAEENFQGAYQIIEAGGIDGVSAIIGYHNNPHLKPGQIGLVQVRLWQVWSSLGLTSRVFLRMRLVLIWVWIRFWLLRPSLTTCSKL